jgi:HipA-like C-terminal domain
VLLSFNATVLGKLLLSLQDALRSDPRSSSYITNSGGPDDRLMLIQQASIDVAMWSPDTEYGVFPQGARPKDSAIAPTPTPDPVLVQGKRYLFKRSRQVYPDQFWAEIVAYRLGSLLGVTVPPTFAAWNSATGQCGALIEWFYVDGQERLVLAGDFLQQMDPTFDRQRGEKHNTIQNEVLLRTLVQRGMLLGDWRQWWADAIAFDALIGNTDRHQDNWGFIFPQSMPSLNKCWLTPYFDNGTALGHELFTDRVVGWGEARIAKYVEKGTHHVGYPKEEKVEKGHLAVLKLILQHWPSTRTSMAERFLKITPTALLEAVIDLKHYRMPIPMSEQRLKLTLRLLTFRLQKIQDILR